MPRYWVSWWSGYYADEGCAKHPFQVWISGRRYKGGDTERDEVAIVSMVDAESEEAIWKAVARDFPDYEPRFCTEQKSDAVPGSRFPGFKGETKLSLNGED